MDIDLRIILVIIGALIIVGLIIVDRIKRKKMQESPYRRVMMSGESEELELPSMSATQEAPAHDELGELRIDEEVDLQAVTEADEAPAIIAADYPQEPARVVLTDSVMESEPEPVAVQEQPDSATEQSPAQSAPETEPEPEQADEVEIEEDPGMVLSLLVLAQKGEKFRGSQIKMAFKETGFVYGEMNIFHQMEGDEAIISIANVLEPGTFELAEISSLKTPGLVLFAQLPASCSGDELFSRWYRSARKLKAALGGRLTDMRQQPLGDDYIDQLRAEAEAFTAIGQDLEQAPQQEQDE